MPTTLAPQNSVSNYAGLLREVRETLLAGQRRIEQEKVQTYWNTGKLIHANILQHKDRADYGTEVIARLSRDLEVSGRLLYQCTQFARTVPNLHARANSSVSPLTWTHYRTLFRVSDERLRTRLATEAAKREWTTDELAEQIKKEVSPDPRTAPTRSADAVALEPRRGEVYTYRMIRPEKIHPGKSPLKIDLGFSSFREASLKGADNLRAGQIAASEWIEGDTYRLKPAAAGEEALYTYYAEVERVVDGDTIIATVDLGFGITTRQYLRLRGIDCPEIDTAEGKKAKKLVETCLAAVPYVVICSSKSDKYDRYLADVYIDGKQGNVFLNQKLLDEELAWKV